MQYIGARLDDASIAFRCFSTFRIMCGSIMLVGNWPRKTNVDVLTEIWDRTKGMMVWLSNVLQSCTPMQTYSRAIAPNMHLLKKKPEAVLEHAIRTKLMCLWSTSCR